VTIPPEFRKDADPLPPALRALLEAELAAGNTIAEVGSYFPAPPAGAFFKMNRPVTTRPRASGDGLTFRFLDNSLYCGSFTDDRGFYFILEPPLPPPPEPDMDAIRAAHAPKPAKPPPIQSDPHTALERFERSMVMDYEKWHDGIGYDLDALRAATPEERQTIETMLLHRGTKDWRDVEALAALDTPRAGQALKSAAEHPDPQIRLAVARNAPKLVADTGRAASLVKAIQTANLYAGLSQALDEAAQFHPKEVVDALFHGALHRDGETAVQFAALLMFVHDKADSPFDWDQRPFFLRFNTQNQKDRETAFVELCQKIGVDASSYL
jgi:hypothetical protein